TCKPSGKAAMRSTPARSPSAARKSVAPASRWNAASPHTATMAAIAAMVLLRIVPPALCARWHRFWHYQCRNIALRARGAKLARKEGERMRNVVRGITGLVGLFNIVLGLGFLLDPAQAGLRFFLVSLGTQGLATMRADFTAFFVTGGAFAIIAA